jgi:Na+/glutamate symporter
LLINVVFGGIVIGKTLPSVRRIWSNAAPHVILGSVFSFGQFAIGGLVVTLLLTPFFGLPDAAGSIIEMSFAGGHGTIAGMGGLLEDASAGELVDVGLGLATISMLTGVIGGTVLVNWAVRRPHIEVAREHTAARSTASRLSEVPPNSSSTNRSSAAASSPHSACRSSSAPAPSPSASPLLPSRSASSSGAWCEIGAPGRFEVIAATDVTYGTSRYRSTRP